MARPVPDSSLTRNYAGHSQKFLLIHTDSFTGYEGVVIIWNLGSFSFTPIHSQATRGSSLYGISSPELCGPFTPVPSHSYRFLHRLRRRRHYMEPGLLLIYTDSFTGYEGVVIIWNLESGAWRGTLKHEAVPAAKQDRPQ